MNEQETQELIETVYAMGLEKFANDESKALEFTEGFVKEAFPMGELQKGIAGALGKGAVGLGLGLGVYGISAMMHQTNQSHLHSKFQSVLSQVRERSPLIKNAPDERVSSYAETIFKFAPHVATDPNLLTAILSNAVHGEGIDPMTIRTLGELESRYIESKKGALFTPNAFAPK